ncbi:MAG: sulfotransferase, partial [Xanthomonadales bacterium]|nr:sulfotransferase [Xanthomonadales bacterium]
FRRKKTGTQDVTGNEGQSAADSGADQVSEAQNTENDERILAAKQQHREGKIVEAESVYLDVLKNDPENAEARHLVGVVCLQRGQLTEAEQHLRQAIELDDKQAPFHSNLGNVLGAQNRTEEAYQCFKQALNLDPQNLTALSNVSTALLSMDRASEAKPYCLRILEIVPEDTNARLNLAAALIEERDTHEAIKVLREALEIKPHDIGSLIQLASALELVNQLDEAFETIEQVEKIKPGIARVSMLTGLIARRQDQFDVAEKHLKEAIERGLSEKEEVEAFNQLGLTLDALGNAKDAFAAFEQSNKVMTRYVGERKADGSGYLREIAEIKNFFTKETSEALGEKLETDESFRPVFFVGFPRSGTTLLVQVLKAHPELVTTDERSPLSAVIQEIRNLPGGYPHGLNNIDPDDLIRLRQTFRAFCWDNLDDLEGKQLVDKLPLNIVHLGLAKLLFPKAKILVALRDPRDACLSCFMQKFEINHAMANFLDLQATGQTYEAVMGLWLQYRAGFEGSWLEYRYENLVENFDDTVSGILDFIGVGWHEDINDYRQAARQRVITTPSYRDVTAPVNDRALARWRRYEQDLTPILPTLEPFVESFAYEK